jgi:hypothetical protein
MLFSGVGSGSLWRCTLGLFQQAAVWRSVRDMAGIDRLADVISTSGASPLFDLVVVLCT